MCVSPVRSAFNILVPPTTQMIEQFDSEPLTHQWFLSDNSFTSARRLRETYYSEIHKKESGGCKSAIYNCFIVIINQYCAKPRHDQKKDFRLSRRSK